MATIVKSSREWAVLVVLALAVTACEMSEVAPSRATAPEVKSAPPRLSKELLSKFGLEELWYDPPPTATHQDTGIQRAFLLEEGLFVVTRPLPGKERRYLKKIDRASGEPVWFHDVDGPIERSPCAYVYPPTVVDKPAELLYSIHDTVHCLDLTYGDELWNAEFKFPLSTPLAANKTHIFVGSDDNRGYAVPKKLELHDWSHLTKSKLQAAPVVTPQKILYASHDGSVYGLEPQRGWVYPGSWRLETQARVVADMARYSGWVFVGSRDYKLYCVRLQDGSVEWDLVTEAPIIDPPVVYRHTANREFVFCFAAKGPSRSPKRTLFAIPLPKGGLAPVAATLWKKEGIRQIVSLGKDTLYAVKEPGPGGRRILVGLDIETGKEKLEISLKGFHFVPTNHADNGRDKKERGRFYLVSITGAIQAIGEKL